MPYHRLNNTSATQYKDVRRSLSLYARPCAALAAWHWHLSAINPPVDLQVGHSAWVWDCAFSADSACLVLATLETLTPFLGAYLISGSSDKTAKLWDVQGGRQTNWPVCMQFLLVIKGLRVLQRYLLSLLMTLSILVFWLLYLFLFLGNSILDYLGHHKAVTAVALNDISV